MDAANLKGTVIGSQLATPFGGVPTVSYSQFETAISGASTVYLELELVARRLEVGLGGDLGQLDVHGGADRRAQVGRAEREVAEALVTEDRVR